MYHELQKHHIRVNAKKSQNLHRTIEQENLHYLQEWMGHKQKMTTMWLVLIWKQNQNNDSIQYLLIKVIIEKENH